ncbi:MAG: universal stress protein [Burkholderiaceae bacterium]|nr:universal stress protein [Burkholderiaceae bacterium]MDH3459998.1 universal stress protein [Burkholderiaceae bacterium]
MNTVLVPIDGSACALRALSHVLQELRNRADTQVHVLNVQQPVVTVWPDKLVSPDMIESELRNRGAEVLVQAQTLAQESGVACIPYVAIGVAAQEITAYATEHGCDAIVMGTRGMGTVLGLVLGSVSQRVVHLAHVPVTLVK